MLKGIHNGARLYVVDPRRTTSAQWADAWLGLNVGSDIALANAMAREIIHAGLRTRRSSERGTTGFDAYRASVEPYTLEYGERETGVPADVIREAAHAYATADRAMICWTLGITEHHNAVDNVLALINLALLTGHVGRYGCGCNPLRGQNNVQGGGDMGAMPNKLPGSRTSTIDPAIRAKFERHWGVTIQPRYGLEPDRDVRRAWSTGDHGALRHRRESGAVRRRPAPDRALLEGLDHLVVQDIFLTRTAQFAHVVLPASATWCEAEGTVTNSERRVQRVPQGAGAAGRRARRHLDHRGDRQADGPRPGDTRRPRTSGTRCARWRRTSPG